MYNHYYRGYGSIFEGTRKLFGFTQRELAQKIGKTQNYLTLIETGRAKSSPVIDKIAQLLRINPSFLSEGPRDPVNPVFVSDFYTFTLKSTDYQPYIFLLTCLSAYSSFIEVGYIFSDVPMLINKRSSPYSRPLVGVGVRDDQGIIFFFTDQDSRKLDTIILTMTPPSRSPFMGFGKGCFFSSLAPSTPDILERRVNASAELSKKILNGTATRFDISTVFFSLDYFKKLVEVHSKMACR